MKDLHSQLARSFNELCERNAILQAQNDSLRDNTMAKPHTPRTSKPVNHPPLMQPTNLPLQNKFTVLDDDNLHVPPQVNEPTAPSAPPISLMTPCKQQKTQQRKTPRQETPKESTQPSPAHSDPDIIIFSNSMCSRIRHRTFYKGKTTKLVAKSGANIPDVQRLVTDFEGNKSNVKCVILQAWTNSTARETIETCKRQSRALVEATLSTFPSAHVIISGVLPRFYHDRGNRVSQELNRIFDRNAQSSRRVTYVDNPPTFLDGTRLREDLYWDSVHLNNYGLGMLVRNLRRAISENVFPHNQGLQVIK